MSVVPELRAGAEFQINGLCGRSHDDLFLQREKVSKVLDPGYCVVERWPSPLQCASIYLIIKAEME
jgi:hypothetical protein